MKISSTFKNIKIVSVILSLSIYLLISNSTFAQKKSTIHPDFPLLDENGINVLKSGAAISTMKTCAPCHDTKYIASHSYHSDAGLKDYSENGDMASGRGWDVSPGFFGKWNSLTYRYLTAKNDNQMDIGTADWIKMFGVRHVGGGPAVYSRNGEKLTSLKVVKGDPETHVLDARTGEQKLWDWRKSGVIEMNCFLCHTPNPNNDARVTEIKAGNFKWANTATLSGSGIVNKKKNSWKYNRSAFNANGRLSASLIKMQDPTDENCAFCHGLIHDDPNTSLLLDECKPEYWGTETTGQIISHQRIRESGMNLAKKESTSRSWDIHAERLVRCVNCHFSINNPSYHIETVKTWSEYLKFEPRRMDYEEFLEYPSHEFAKGNSVNNTSAPELNNTMRRCESCHNLQDTHNWLPYKKRHLQELGCESCHIPKMYSPTRRLYDWTVVKPNGQARIECRGIENDQLDIRKLINGYQPVFLLRKETEGSRRLMPYNLITSYFWLCGNPERPVRLQDLQAAYFDGDKYYPEIISALDRNQDKEISDDELVLDTKKKIDLIKKRLIALGVKNPRIASEIQPYDIHHNVTNGEWVTKDCESCHSNNSRITSSLVLAARFPVGVKPEFVQDSNADISGEISVDNQGRLIFQPASMSKGLYILGHDSVSIVKWIGLLIFLGVLFGVTVHGGLRIIAAKKFKHHAKNIKQVYMYEGYERFWHWLQALVIILLIFTGMVIHLPDLFGSFSFKGMIYFHNVLGSILLLNALLAIFYYLASGRVKMFIPEPKGFFSQSIEQTLYYLGGIFKGEPHPFEKENIVKKLNPLQKVTYLIILNILLPLQIISGGLILGLQHLPRLNDSLGGLYYLLPIHNLIAWLFLSFLVMHIYLATTGLTPFASIKAMFTGWEDIEQHNEEVK